MTRRVFLVVTGGLDVGARLLVGREPQLVGRERDASLVVSDTRVSRHHFQIVASDVGAILRVMPKARPLLYGGAPHELVEIPFDGTFRVGDTEFSVVSAADEGPTQSFEAFSLDTRTLLTGVGAESRFAALFELAEGLDGVDGRERLQALVSEWAQRCVGATSVALLEEGEVEDMTLRSAMAAGPNAVHRIQASDGSTTVIAVPSHTRDKVWLNVRLPRARDDVSDQTQRLLLLAGKLCASRLGGLRVHRAVTEDREALRQLSSAILN